MTSSGKRAVWRCRCVCGNERIASGADLRWGRTVSCGCGRTAHGHTGGFKGKRTLTYSSWQNLIARCTNPNASSFDYYRERGITVCERWRSFENFLADMGERPSRAHTIDRYPNNDGNYEPGNCRWATKREQANNRLTNKRFTYRGKSYTLADLARETGVSKEILRVRLVRPGGWTVEGAINTPKLKRSKTGERFVA